MNSRKNNGSMQPDWRRIGLSVGVCMLLMLAMAAAIAGMVSSEIIDRLWMDELAALTLVITGFAGGRIARSGNSLDMDGWLAIGCYWMMMLLLRVVLFGVDLRGMGAVALTIAGGCGASQLTGAGKNRRPKRRKHAYR